MVRDMLKVFLNCQGLGQIQKVVYLVNQSEGRNGFTEVPGCEDGTGLSQAPLVVHVRAWPSNQSSSGMYSSVYCTSADSLGARQTLLRMLLSYL